MIIGTNIRCFYCPAVLPESTMEEVGIAGGGHPVHVCPECADRKAQEIADAQKVYHNE